MKKPSDFGGPIWKTVVRSRTLLATPIKRTWCWNYETSWNIAHFVILRINSPLQAVNKKVASTQISKRLEKPKIIKWYIRCTMQPFVDSEPERLFVGNRSKRHVSILDMCSHLTSCLKWPSIMSWSSCGQAKKPRVSYGFLALPQGTWLHKLAETLAILIMNCYKNRILLC